MRTKALILSAVALAAGVLSSNAQVYSANVVGYYNITVPAAKKAVISAQLLGGPSGTSSLINDILTNGVPDGSSLLIWNGASFKVDTFFEGFGWFDENSNLETNSLKPGQGAFFINGNPSLPATITVVGTVPQGGRTNAVPVGRFFYSIPAPVSTNLDSALVKFPSKDGDSYLQWNIASQNYPAATQLTYFEGFGWFDSGSVQRFPSPEVGTSFFYVNANSPTNWVFNFTVQ